MTRMMCPSTQARTAAEPFQIRVIDCRGGGQPKANNRIKAITAPSHDVEARHRVITFVAVQIARLGQCRASRRATVSGQQTLQALADSAGLASLLAGELLVTQASRRCPPQCRCDGGRRP